MIRFHKLIKEFNESFKRAHQSLFFIRDSYAIGIIIFICGSHFNIIEATEIII